MGSVHSLIYDFFIPNSEILRSGAESESREQTYEDIPELNRSTEKIEQDIDNDYESQVRAGDIQTGSPMVFDDELLDVGQTNFVVKYDGGKQLDVDVFPLEKVQLLLDIVCEQAMKDPKKMHLVYEGEPLDVTKTVCKCKLKRGRSIILARKS